MSASSIADLLLALGKKDIKLLLEDGRLRVNAPKGVLTAELKNELVQRKPELLTFLANTAVSEDERIPLVSANVAEDASFPLSFAQERFWYLHALYPEASAYHVQEVIPVEWPKAVIVAVLKNLAERHAILRTTYHMENAVPVQRVHPELPLLFSTVDVGAISDDELPVEVLAQAQSELRQAFELSTGPVWRARLLARQGESYRLVLTVHHIATDGWSMELLQRDFIALCRVQASDTVANLPLLPIQYLDYAAWHREWMSGERLQQQLDYWLKRLEGAPHQIDLPFDHPRSTIHHNAGELYVVSLSVKPLKKLRALAAGNQVTLYMALLAVFNLLLARYTRQADIVVGTPVAGRERSEAENIAGLFLNTLVLRNTVSKSQSFTELLQEVKASTLGAFDHQQLPFEKLVETLKPEREANANPIYQVMFNYFVPQGGDNDDDTVDISLDKGIIDINAVQVDLSLYVHVETTKLNFGFAYSSALFDADTVIRMAGHFLNLLHHVIDAPTQAVGTITMLSNAERRQLIEVWNTTEADYPQDVRLHQLFEQQVQHTPDAVAVANEDAELSYRELNQRADQLANYLSGRGVGYESVVAVLMERSLEMVIALYGILKAGAAYVPIDPDLPQERIAFMLEDTQAKVVLTQQHLCDRLTDKLIEHVCVDSDWPSIAGTPQAENTIVVFPECLAYIIYTSGSTGKPKGVMNCHRGIVNRILWMQARYQLTSDDRVLQKTPFSFDVSVWEFFWPLMCGARLVVAKPGGHKDPRYLSQLIAEAGITTLHFVPSMLKAFLEHGELEKIRSLKRVMCSGEALSFELQQHFFQVSEAELHNLYGPTEAAVDVTSWACQRDAGKQVVPIGKPIANTQIYILDARMQPVPIGVAGELHIGGVQVARGYLNRADLTAEKFIADPFSEEPEARLYKTGDLARYLADGNIEYLGRLDYQVKLRGFRIELGEIEATLEQHDEIAMAVAMVREDVKGDQRLVAYVTPGHHRQVDTGEIREHLRQGMPEYMVPAYIVWLDTIPLTPSGKADRKALPAPTHDMERSVAASDLPGSDHERIMVRIWEELLEIDDVHVFDTFFDLGGHSLLTLKVVSRFEEETGIRLNPADLVIRTLRQLVAGLDATTDNVPSSQKEEKQNSGLLGVFKKGRAKGE